MKIRTALLPLVLSLCLLAGCGGSSSGTAANQNGVSMETGAAAEVSDSAGGMGGTLDTDARPGPSLSRLWTRPVAISRAAVRTEAPAAVPAG